MQVQIEEVSPVEKKLIVEVPWDNVSVRLGKSYRELAKEVNLKGFRKGKVPRSVLERLFSERVHAKVAGELVHESFMTALSEHKLEAVAEPRVDIQIEINKGKPTSFEAIVEVKGEVEVENYKGMELTKRPVKIDEDDLEHTLSHLRKDHMDLLPIEDRKELTTDDMVTISLKGTIGDQEIDRDDINLDLGDDHHEPLPGMHAAIVGLPIDTKDHEIVIEIPEDHQESQMAGKTAKFQMSVLDAKYKDLPELTDDFAKDTGKAETMDELRAGIRKEAEDRQLEQIKGELHQAAIDELVKRNPIVVASSLKERAIQNHFQRIQQMMGMQPGMQAPPLDDEIRARLSEEAEDEVRSQLLLDALAEAEGIEVSDEAVDERVAEMAARRGKTAGRLRAEMRHDGRLENIVYLLKQDKAVEVILASAKVEEKEPEPEEDKAEATSDESDSAEK
ncbi:MAG: trigger factor [Myxococcales bacterium]|nr:trigger factor [Myxococcales bacterium]